MSIPRPEYPREQMKRKSFFNLNGTWEFEIDHGRSGKQRSWHKEEAAPFSRKITVPFCPESKLSGVEYTDFMECVWYRRTVTIGKADLAGRLLLHFGAVDYAATVYVNGGEAGRHRGGYSSFAVDITDLARVGENTITVCAEDDVRSGRQPRGKQSGEYYSHGCDYTRTTGIWQTVWMEAVPSVYIKRYQLTPDPENGRASLRIDFSKPCYGACVKAEAFYKGKPAGAAEVKSAGGSAFLTLPIDNPVLWEVGKPELYDLVIAAGEDRVEGYFGMRSVALTENAILLNGKPVFQRLVLDQGFYPDGIYTAPSDEALKNDILLSMQAGFNGARLHQKIFEERFYYWADKLGYLVWGEHGNWGLNISGGEGLADFLPEWVETVQRDYNHPSLVGWCPFNETYKEQDDRILAAVYQTTKALDYSRPVIDTSGYVHVVTDVFDIHDYEQKSDAFRACLEGMKGPNIYNPHAINGRFDQNIPYFVSEYGGVWWNAAEAEKKESISGWGYGNRPEDIEEVYSRMEGLTRAMLENPRVCAYCYTQLTDVEQEQNGIYYYDRTPKFDAARLRAIFGGKAAIEE